MGFLLNFFGAGGLQLKALIVGAAAMLIACLGLTTWALFERSGRLSCEVDRVALRAQVSVLSDQLNRQSKAVGDHAAIGAAVQDALREDLDKLARLAARRDPILNELADLARNPPKRADGKPVDCNDAWAEIEKRRKP